MPRQRPPSIAISLVLFVGGLLLAYYILRINGLHSGIAVAQMWARLSMKMRVLAVSGFIISAYGLGAIVNNLSYKEQP
jgi:hypothetical protein